MSTIKNGGYQYGTEPFEPQQFGTAGVEGVKVLGGMAYRLAKFEPRPYIPSTKGERNALGVGSVQFCI